MDVEQIYKQIDSLILTHLMLNDDAMKTCQALGYNGFKRLHRCNTKDLMCYHSKLENCYYDKYFKILDTDVNAIKYTPLDLKAHLQNWKSYLNNGIQKLGELNKEHFYTVGIGNNIIEELMCDMWHDYEKVTRWIKRFEESEWDSIDCHIVDDYLHKKMKEKEKN